ncbi:hypothetical protein RHSIM_Rhsim08G0229600 [Rhododendron simsii]|uniref:Protein kinase domain-containing protein n=1 Tax=Rhododendron simsii TaxID=118357 RepID=A0A834GHR0_RHOSS|nr:hypothetical protein RHSIM_Rhsim08G0229600 [Rhododendron simsii]
MTIGAQESSTESVKMVIINVTISEEDSSTYTEGRDGRSCLGRESIELKKNCRKIKAPQRFISIDCGISEGSDYNDEFTAIAYTSDAGYIDTGTNHNISLDYMPKVSRRLSSLRSFPDGIKNCYTIHQVQAGGDKYLIRAYFMYGNYDSKNQPPEFELYLDGDQWGTVMFDGASYFIRAEIIHNVPATSTYIHVCLVNTGLGTPFISTLELRRLDTSIYKTNSGSLKLLTRIDVGSTTNEIVSKETKSKARKTTTSQAGRPSSKRLGVGDLDAADKDLRGIRSGGAEGEEAWDGVFSKEEGDGAGRAAGEEGGVEGGKEGDWAAPNGGVGEGGSEGGEVLKPREERTRLKRRKGYSDDVYDRIWFPDTILGFTTPALEPIRASYNSDTLSSNDYKPPCPVMATAVRPVNGLNSLNISVGLDYPREPFYVYMHFAEIETLAADQKREFDIYINDRPWHQNVTTNFLQPNTIFSTYAVSADLELNFSIRATEESTLPPILNAIEFYEFLELQSPTPTNGSEVDAIRNVKSVYGVERNWQGDPCVPREYKWEDLQCNYDRNSTRIISLNLSSSSLSGNMDVSFSRLTSLESLDLSNNNLTGPVPDFLSELPSLKTLNLSRNNFTGSIPPALIEKSKIGSLTLRTEGNLHLFQAENSSKGQADWSAREKTFIALVIASIASCLVIVVVILAIWWSLKRRKHQAHIVKSNPENEMVEEKKRQFTYVELMTITNNFEKLLGKGASGSVYAGHLTDDTKDVAVKMFFLSSTHEGYCKQFQTEASVGDVHWKIQARLLTKVHHRNLVSIIGYCNEGQHMGLVYEYMANGTVKEHLSALEYLHDDCKPPIIHRDIKTSNILLTENMQAKISDFGLFKLMPSDGGTHVLTGVAGTRGYMDPKYIASYKLNKKSDVYSFGVVLLELITGKPPVLETPEKTLLVNWIVPMVERRAEIKEIMDLRLNSDFDTSSARKALETAMACVECNLSQRLVMRQVGAILRDCLEMEKARVKVWKENEVHNSASSNSVYVSILGSLVGGPSAR